MRKSRCTEEQTTMALRQADARTPFSGLGVTELHELPQPREENLKLKGRVADLTLDKQILQESLRKEW